MFAIYFLEIILKVWCRAFFRKDQQLLQEICNSGVIADKPLIRIPQTANNSKVISFQSAVFLKLVKMTAQRVIYIQCKSN